MGFKDLAKEPLGHFLVAGLVVYYLVSPGEQHQDIDRIYIDRDVLATFVQYRTKTFQPDYADRVLSGMSRAELQGLIAEYQREEALYREAQALGMERGDYVIRQRLLGKMDFLTDRELPTSAIDESELSRFFETHQSDYVEPAAVSFTHVFISGKNQSGAQTATKANALLRELADKDVTPTNALDLGDRFLFHTNYVDRGQTHIAAELGAAAAAAIFSTEMPVAQWSGPVASDYGLHIIFLTERSLAINPELNDVRIQVVNDFKRAKQRELQLALEEEIVSSYETEISPTLERWLSKKDQSSTEK